MMFSKLGQTAQCDDFNDPKLLLLSKACLLGLVELAGFHTDQKMTPSLSGFVKWFKTVVRKKTDRPIFAVLKILFVFFLCFAPS